MKYRLFSLLAILASINAHAWAPVRTCDQGILQIQQENAPQGDYDYQLVLSGNVVHHLEANLGAVSAGLKNPQGEIVVSMGHGGTKPLTNASFNHGSDVISLSMATTGPGCPQGQDRLTITQGVFRDGINEQPDWSPLASYCFSACK